MIIWMSRIGLIIFISCKDAQHRRLIQKKQIVENPNVDVLRMWKSHEKFFHDIGIFPDFIY